MDNQDQDFLRRLFLTFELEAREHIGAITSGLLALEGTTAPDPELDIIETIFRETHSLKGAARAVNFTEVEEVCQALESVFAALKGREISLSPELFDALHQAANSLSTLLAAAGADLQGEEKSQIQGLLQHLAEAPQWAGNRMQGSASRDPVALSDSAPQLLRSAPLSPTALLPDTVRISTAKLDSLLLQAEELLAAKLTASQQVAELHDLNTMLATWQADWARARRTIGVMPRSRQGADKRRELGRPPTATTATSVPMRPLLELMERHDSQIKALASKLAALAKSAEQEHRALARMVDDLLEDMKRVSMQPFSALLEIFPKLARDLARHRGKEVEVVIRGGNVEIDRQILEEMKEPLIHVVRNCIDHGIEAPQAREGKHKARRGTVTVAISQKNGSKVELLVADDGAGIDVPRVKAVAQKLSIIAPEQADHLDEREVLGLIFQSGLSTSPIVTDISGRGLGLAIVREKAEKLGGMISVETSRDVGTTFRIILPLRLATLRGVLVRVAEHLFVVPLTQVERVLRVRKAEIKTVENRETLQLNGQAISLVRLDTALGLSRKDLSGAAADSVPVIVLVAAEKRIAFSVEAILGEQEVLVKRLGPQLPRVRNIAGATILGTGQVVPVLNVFDVLKSAIRASAVAIGSDTTVAKRAQAGQKSVLLVEDSITTRMLLKNLLEAVGYHVSTAVDGVDGLTQLLRGGIDIVISDVDMPRMNGFDLTTRIRGEKRFADLPVVLLTALASDADRQRGMEVGANAYVVKSRFDQSDLLAVVQRLV